MGNAVNRWCSVEHAMQIARTRQAASERKEKKATSTKRKADKAKVKRIGDLKADKQKAFNCFIRARDKGKPCISCGHPDDGSRQRQAGHYQTVGGNGPLRYDEANCHAQCMPCNFYHGGGKHPGYRTELIRRIGQAEVDRLEGPQPPVKWTREELITGAAMYRAKARATH